jgi:hypothetical protein
MPVLSTIYAPAKLTVHRVTGVLTPEEVRETLHDFYTTTGPTRDVLWDARRARWDHEAAAGVLAAIKEGLGIYHAQMNYRHDGRTAVVVGSKPALGLAVIAQQLFEGHEPPLTFEVEVFLDMKKATEWLTRTPLKAGQVATDFFGRPEARELLDIDDVLDTDKPAPSPRPTH